MSLRGSSLRHAALIRQVSKRQLVRPHQVSPIFARSFYFSPSRPSTIPHSDSTNGTTQKGTSEAVPDSQSNEPPKESTESVKSEQNPEQPVQKPIPEALPKREVDPKDHELAELKVRFLINLFISRINIYGPSPNFEIYRLELKEKFRLLVRMLSTDSRWIFWRQLIC
jgi:hypothetical protein